jgi:acyl-CoA thioesterase
MDEAVKNAIYRAVENEPFAQRYKMALTELGLGRSVVTMRYDPEAMDNIYARAHGGAIFGLIDEAFETAAQTYGTIAVALNMNITYVASPRPGSLLTAAAKQISRTKKTAAYEIRVSDDHQSLIAVCQALAYQTGKSIYTGLNT